MALSQLLKIPPPRILYIGDSYEKDYLAANKIGMCGVWLNRLEVPTNEEDKIIGAGGDVEVQEDNTTSTLTLNSLYPEEVEKKVLNFINKNNL